MIDYDWCCNACDATNSKSATKCHNCGCSANPNRYEVELYKVLIESCSIKKKLSCPNCHFDEISVRYGQDYNEYYGGFKKRAWYFNILEIFIDCNKCDYRKVVEHEVPFLRNLYRRIAKKDIQSAILKKM